jgi:hypothetical protein
VRQRVGQATDSKRKTKPHARMRRVGITSETWCGLQSVCDYNQQTHAGMVRIDQVIVTVDVVDIHIVAVIIPIGRPRIGVLEIIAAVIKAAVIAAPHVEAMFMPETDAELLVRDAPAATSVLIRLMLGLLLLGTILLLCGPGLLIAIGLVLLLGAIILLRPVVLPRLIILFRSIILARAIILLSGLGAILLLSVGFLFGALGGFLLFLPASVRLLSLFWLFLLFWFLFRFIFIGFLPGVTGGADKEHHHRCTKDKFHFDSSVFFANSHAYIVDKTTNLGLAGMDTF